MHFQSHPCAIKAVCDQLSEEIHRNHEENCPLSMQFRSKNASEKSPLIVISHIKWEKLKEFEFDATVPSLLFDYVLVLFHI